ncbi:MAG: phenylalanine 4-monooxygenase [Alphaproteobacteria bacterium]
MELRGDYGSMRPDYTVDQDWSAYSAADHETWRLLLRRQMRLLPGHACAAFADGVAALGLTDRIPRFDEASAILERATGWRIVAVPGLLPDAQFFEHLAGRRFPVTVWMRRRDEIDYLVEPDLFHDFFGHVPLLLDPVFADFLHAYGTRGRVAAGAALRRLARLYWYTVEFGLLATPAGLKAFGAGLLSSRSELVHAVTDPRPLRVRFDARRVMSTDYRIDRFQETYFVLDGFDELYATLSEDATQPGDLDYAPGERAPGDALATLPALASVA